MRKYKYSCDGGTLLLGNENFQCAYVNNYGDGTHRVYIKDHKEEWPKLPNGVSFHDLYHFEGDVKGKFNVYAYDCLNNEELTAKENILTTLTGRYFVYSVKHSGDMILACWGD